MAMRMVDHPDLVRCYFRNKIRAWGLANELSNHDDYSKYPLGITLKPTLRCKRCSFVASGDVLTDPCDSLPLDVWKSVVDDVRPWRPYIWVTGGEPTLYPDFVSLVQYIKREGMMVGVTTDGTTLKKKAEEILENPMDMLVISIEDKGSIHNKVRGYQRAMSMPPGESFACRI